MFKKCHISIFIPGLFEYMENFDNEAEHSFLKYRLDYPQNGSKNINENIKIIL